MIDTSHKWYHYLMIPANTQFGIMAACAVMSMVQFLVYDVIQDNLIVFDEECVVTVGPILTNDSGEETVYKGASMLCGDKEVSLHQMELEAAYLYEVLTNNKNPVIICQNSVTEYLRKSTWSCEMNPKEES